VRWQVEWGDRIDFLKALAARSGREPQALADRPELFEDLQAVAEGFAVLSVGRTVSVGVAAVAPDPIPLAEIEAYCRLNGIADGAEFSRLIRAMDATYLERYRDRRAGTSVTGRAS
jgi:hypothetical protein